MTTPHELFLSMLQGKSGGVVDESGTIPPSPEKKKKPGLKPEQWEMINALLQPYGSNRPLGAPGAGVVHGGSSGNAPLLDPTKYMVGRAPNPLWADLLKKGG